MIVPGCGQGESDGCAAFRRPASTAFPGDAARLRRWLRRGRVDARSFQRRVARCRLTDCRGMCCYDGAVVSWQTRRVLERLVIKAAEAFRALGLRLPAQSFVRLGWWPLQVHKTATRLHRFSAVIADYPAHFGDSACVFMLDDGRCGLQVLSVDRGLHPWHYKPTVCWMQPIKLATEPGFSVFLPRQDTDPSRHRGYPGYVEATACGCSRPGGEPASRVLDRELRFLGAVTGVPVRSQVGVVGP